MKRRELEERLGSVEQLLDKVDRSVEKIETVTLVREPSTGMSADAYNGLRKQVIAAASERAAHLNQLAQFDASLRAGATDAELQSLVREWIGQASLLTIEDPAMEDAFEVVGPESASGVRVLRPGYVDGQTGRVVRAGLLERVDLEEEPLAEADEEFGEDEAEVPAGTTGGAQ